jgi:hypothetical protein
LVGSAQVVTRDGFDVRRHALSHLSNGTLGWIQIGNFLLSGALVIAGAQARSASGALCVRNAAASGARSSSRRSAPG